MFWYFLIRWQILWLLSCSPDPWTNSETMNHELSKWPILAPFCEMDHQKSNFFTDIWYVCTNFCLRLLSPADVTVLKTGWWNSNVQTSWNQKIQKMLIIRTIQFHSFQYETPCTINPFLEGYASLKNHFYLWHIWNRLVWNVKSNSEFDARLCNLPGKDLLCINNW